MNGMDCVVAGVPACLLLGCIGGGRNLPNKAGRDACHRAIAVLTSLLLFAVQPLRAQGSPNDQSARLMRLDRFVLPEFPPFLRQAGVMQGTVVAAIGHDEKGRADDILILESSDPRFSDAALDAIREWRFQPHADAARAGDAAPVVRFLFTTGSVSVVPLTASSGGVTRRAVRADSPIELPNFSHLDQPPPLLQQATPEFPAALRSRVTRGTVVVKYFVDSTGRVRLPSVISATEPEFGAAALTAIRQWRYEPPRIDGKPVVALERHAFEFSASGAR
jgi:TonB family protein